MSLVRSIFDPVRRGWSAWRAGQRVAAVVLLLLALATLGISVRWLQPQAATMPMPPVEPPRRAAAGEGEQDGSMAIRDAQLRLRKDVESYLAAKANDLLSGVLGPGRFAVRVNADLDFAQLERSRETYEPQTVLRSEEKRGSQGGTVTRYEVPRTLETVLKNDTIVQRLTVAVVVDGKPARGGAADAYVARSEAELAQIQRMVAGALGILPTRGDVVEVVNMPFDAPALPDGTAVAWTQHPWVSSVPRWLAAAVLILLAAAVGGGSLGILLRSGREMATSSARDATPPEGPDEGLADLRGLADWVRAEPEAVANVLQAFATRED